MARRQYAAERGALLASEEVALRFLARRDLADEDPTSRSMRALREQVRGSSRVAALLAGRKRTGAATYRKWQGAHWVTIHLAMLGCAGGDPGVDELVDEVLEHWTAPQHLTEREVTQVRSGELFVPVVHGKARRCASQQGGALWAAITLGYGADPRVGLLAERLARWQWPDGGWNCDRRPEARMSSVNESFLPMRGLAAHPGYGGEVARAAGFFLERHVAYRRSVDQPIHRSTVQLHFPPYWHYDVLAGLDALRDADHLRDPRCTRALELLERLRLPDGGWPATARWYRVRDDGSNVDSIDWGPTGSTLPNPWVTLIALRVLRAAGRH
ncbi:hypothetical protein [Microbacterium sp. NPDC056569]|uniref:hypothetical protein n=1 Tax=Microbacterium sp. NPDC056569 TaxID=3345867 RepID=UPI00366D91CA